jgi:hypothetical protein
LVKEVFQLSCWNQKDLKILWELLSCQMQRLKKLSKATSTCLIKKKRKRHLPLWLSHCNQIKEWWLSTVNLENRASSKM